MMQTWAKKQGGMKKMSPPLTVAASVWMDPGNIIRNCNVSASLCKDQQWHRAAVAGKSTLFPPYRAKLWENGGMEEKESTELQS